MTPAIALPVVDAPTSPTQHFRCAHYACVLTAAECLKRQRPTHLRRWAHGTKSFSRKFVPAHLQFCASGKCEQGAAIAGALEPAGVVA